MNHKYELTIALIPVYMVYSNSVYLGAAREDIVKL